MSDVVNPSAGDEAAAGYVIEPTRDRQGVDAAADIWARATAARDGDEEVAELDVSRPIIQRVLDRSPSAFVLLATSHPGVAAGFAAIEPLKGTSGTVAEVVYFGVRPDLWGRGIATLLLAELQHRLPRAGFASIELSVYVANSRAIEVYERMGRRPLGSPTPHPRTGKPEQRYAWPTDGTGAKASP